MDAWGVGRRWDARTVDGDDVLDEHVAARAVERDASTGSRIRLPPAGDVHRVVDVEERRDLTRGNQSHRVLIETAVALHGRRRAKRSTAEILDVIAFHDRRVGIEEEAPVGLVTPEERFQSRPGVVPEFEEGEPPVTDLLSEDADRAVLAQEGLERNPRDTPR